MSRNLSNNVRYCTELNEIKVTFEKVIKQISAEAQCSTLQCCNTTGLYALRPVGGKRCGSNFSAADTVKIDSDSLLNQTYKEITELFKN